MPPYGSLHSPSIRKMNGGIDGKSRRNGTSRPVSLRNILGDPFGLATVSIALLAWFISLIGSVIATADKSSIDFPNYSWFALAYMFCCILGVFIVIASDNIQTYHIAIVGFLACGLVLTTSSINSLIYTSNGAKEAVAAGHILLSMINVGGTARIAQLKTLTFEQIIWIFYFGSTPSAMPRAYLDSFALHKDRRTSQGGRAPVSDYGTVRPDTSVSSNAMPQMYTSAQIGGLKSSTPIVPLSSNGLGPDQIPSQQRYGNGGPPINSNFDPSSRMSLEPTVAEVGVPTEYPYRAKAIYSYEANPEDANEISFSKHEILDVSDVSGRWWQAKKKNGETGIAPSNYLILL